MKDEKQNVSYSSLPKIYRKKHEERVDYRAHPRLNYYERRREKKNSPRGRGYKLIEM